MTTLVEHTSSLLARISDRTASIGIVGMGYVGLPLALLFSEQGFPVTGFDIDATKVSKLNGGDSYIVRIPGTEIQSARGRGFSATGDYAAISRMDAVI
ncbi:MAG TPA: NAD(P)-binding domain-containing protein, partial [Acidobacteriaceae bacterium]|nr:NAD(P)-binding domain-containing protein [Acidobacteriaceae bacterium]